MEIASFWILLFASLIIGVPVAFAISVSAFGLLVLFAEGLPFKAVLVLMSQRMFAGTDSFPLLALPLFFLAGALMQAGGLSERLVRLASALVGWVRGGLSMVVVLAEMFFAGITGSPSAVSAAIGSVMIPALKERGYGERFSAALVAAGGAVGPIIPPSIMLVVYGSLSNVSIASLFIGGIIPGILMALALMGLCFTMAILRGYPKEERLGLAAIGRALKEAVLPLATPAIILGGIFSGVFTATESAMVAVLYALLVSKFVYRSLSWSDVIRVCSDSAVSSARIMFIIATAAFVGWVLAREQVPQEVSTYLLSLSRDPVIILLIINALFLVFGCFIEGIAIMIILLPTILPVIQQLGIDPMFFGVMIVINLAIGTVTPPVGTCLIITSMIAKLPFDQVFREILPFIAVMIAVLLMLVVAPELVTWLPSYFY